MEAIDVGSDGEGVGDEGESDDENEEGSGEGSRSEQVNDMISGWEQSLTEVS